MHEKHQWKRIKSPNPGSDHGQQMQRAKRYTRATFNQNSGTVAMSDVNLIHIFTCDNGCDGDIGTGSLLNSIRLIKLDKSKFNMLMV